MTTIKEAVLSTVEQLLDAQNAKGMKNYGKTLDDCPVDDYNWQNMINEELIDALQYQQKEIRRLNAWKESAEQVMKGVAKLNKFISTNDIGNGRWGESVTQIAIDELQRLLSENEKLKEELES